MTLDIKELVKRLHGGKCPQCYGFGEVSYGGELVRCSCLDKYEAPISMEHRKAAADALEAMAGEVAEARLHEDCANNVASKVASGYQKLLIRAEAAEAERDRLAGEAETAKSQFKALQMVTSKEHEDTRAERDRLQLANARMKAALAEIEERAWSISFADDIVALARKALGGDA